MHRPWISCNLAISADGKISSPGHRPADWTSARDGQRLKQLRCPADALMVGRGTCETDRMTMLADGDGSPPLRCIVSRHGELSPDHPVFSAEGGAIHLLATESYRGDHGKQVTVHQCELAEFLTVLRDQLLVGHLHCEGGGQLIRSLAAIDAIDEFHLTWAGHSLLGGGNAPTLTGLDSGYLETSRQFRITHLEPVEKTGECFLSYRRATQ